MGIPLIEFNRTLSDLAIAGYLELDDSLLLERYLLFVRPTAQVQREASAAADFPQWDSERRRLFILEFAMTCFYCRRKGTMLRDPDGSHWAREHMIGRGDHGSNHPGNLVLSCKHCNSAKRTKPAGTYLQMIQRRRVAATRRAEIPVTSEENYDQPTSRPTTLDLDSVEYQEIRSDLENAVALIDRAGENIGRIRGKRYSGWRARLRADRRRLKTLLGDMKEATS